VLPLVNPVTSQVTVDAFASQVVGVSLPLSAVTEYPLMLEPLLAGADHDTLADSKPDVTRTSVTVEGAWAAGVPDVLLDGSEVPIELVAVTVTA
jgi:hypothetical protein